MNDLMDLRKEIWEIDRQIVKLAAKRFQIVQKIGDYKKKKELPIVNIEVENKVVSEAVLLGKKLGLPDSFTSKIISIFIQEAIKTQSGKPINRAIHLYEVLEKVKELEAKGQSIIRLEVGEPDLSPPYEIKKAATTSLVAQKHIGYGSSLGLPALREAIVEVLSQKYNINLNANQVLITTGGKLAVFAAIFSFISAGDGIVFPEPFWPVYDNCSRLAEGRISYIHTCLENDWRIDIEQLDDILSTKPKLLILCSPSNPTGKIIPENDFREIYRLAKESGTYVLSDEVYSAFTFKPAKSILEITDSHFVYVNSFSKEYGMTGWRIGYAVSDKDIISKMQKLVQISTTCVPEFIQKAAFKALTMDQSRYKSFAKEMSERITLACKQLDKYPVSYSKPEGGMYLFPKVDKDSFDSKKFAQQLLLKKKVSIAPGEAFGDYPEHFRISLGTNKENIKEGINRIGGFVEQWLRE